MQVHTKTKFAKAKQKIEILKNYAEHVYWNAN